MLKSLRVKFVCINMTIVTILLGVIFGTIFHFTQTHLFEETERSLRTTALNMNPIHQRYPLPSSSHVLPHPIFTIQVNSNGDLSVTGGEYHGVSDQTYARELVTLASDYPNVSGSIRKYHLQFYRMRPAPDTLCIAFADTSEHIEILQDLAKKCLLIGGLGFLLFLMVSILLARWAIKPVEKTWEQQKQFVANASHDLKTPLTVIATNAELLHAPACTEEKRMQFSESILTMSQQMRGLITSMLDLARADQGASNMSVSPVDFSKLIYRTLLPFEPLFFERELTLTDQIEPNIQLHGDPDLLRQAVEVLLDNARKYAQPNSEVTVTLKKPNRTCCLLSVSNVGTPIPAPDLENIFKRFYRADPARTSSGSYGLGLPIAERIVQNHRGKIWASSVDGRNTFYIQLPL